MRRRIAVFAAIASCFGLLGVMRPNGLSDVVAVRHWSYPDYTRVVVETTKEIHLETMLRHLAADRSATLPERLYLDLGDLWVGRRYVNGIELGDGLLRGVRLGQNTLRTTRLVLDLENYDRHRLFTLKHPYRLVIDIFGHRHERPTPPPEMRLPSSQRPVQTVVLDAGHGGRDPGAIGVGGLREKTITLRLARSLGAKLETAGFKVVYTRNDDRSMSLDERTAIAEATRADLFVSVHANAAPRRSAQGVETYYLDEDHERHSLRVAARENGVTRDQVDDLQRTLARLRVGELSGYSRRLADMVQSEIVHGLPRNFRVHDLGVKKGPFYVLFLSDTPAILVEAGFITNRIEAKRLRSGAYIEALATQIAAGLTRYREGNTRLARGDPP
ncbi:MAG: N-acetylmuramoyl-L-alanine amidase [Myxococcota bacterium]